MIHPFTPTYIAMAKAAEEIQAMRPDVESFENGDYVSGEEGIDVLAHAVEYWVGQIGSWLPRLDQLLGILTEGEEDPVLGLGQIFYSWKEFTIPFRQEEHEPGLLRPDEKEWWYWGSFANDFHAFALALLMRKKYEKSWNGTNWETKDGLPKPKWW